MSVDLPAPFSPTSTLTLPRYAVKVTSFSARTPAVLLLTPRAASHGVGGSVTAPPRTGWAPGRSARVRGSENAP